MLDSALKNYYVETSFKKIFIIFIVICMAVIFFNLTFIGTDEIILWALLTNGEDHTLILSLPFAKNLSYLYSVAPSFPWFSLFFLSLHIYLGFLFASILIKFSNSSFFYPLFVSFALILIYSLMNISITFLTILFFALSLCFLNTNILLFLITVIIAIFLRTSIIPSILPYWLLGLLAFSRMGRELVSGYKFIALFFIALTFLLVAYVNKNQLEYSNWLHYYKAKAYFIDLKGAPQQNILDENETILVKSWWTGDKKLLSNEKIIKAAGSQLDIVLEALRKIDLSSIVKKLYNNPLLLYALVLSLILFAHKNIPIVYKLVLLLNYFGIFLLLYIRNVPRVTLALTILYLFILFFTAQRFYIGKRAIRYAITGFLVLFVSYLPLNKIYGEYKYHFYYDEYKVLLERHNDLVIENSNGFPASNITQPVIQLNFHLFHEDEWIYNKYKNVIFAGWIGRHPFFYRQHNISFANKKRKYDSYYDFMLSKDTAYIGDKEPRNTKLEKTILHMYDKKYCPSGECHHEVVTIDELDHAVLKRIVKVKDD